MRTSNVGMSGAQHGTRLLDEAPYHLLVVHKGGHKLLDCHGLSRQAFPSAVDVSEAAAANHGFKFNAVPVVV
jgi:hypothetical protein